MEFSWIPKGRRASDVITKSYIGGRAGLGRGPPPLNAAHPDAIVVIAALLGLVAFAPTLRYFRPRHWVTAVLLAAAMAGFFYGLKASLSYAGHKISPVIHRIEQTAPS
jgi:hypothetical protein